MAEFPPDRYPLVSSPEAYADLVTVAGFKPVVAAEKPPGGFDSLPLPFAIRHSNLPVADSVIGRRPLDCGSLLPLSCSQPAAAPSESS